MHSQQGFGKGPGGPIAYDFGSDGRPVIRDVAGAQALAFPSGVKGLYAVRVPVAGTASSSGVFASLVNPFGVDAIVYKAVLDVSTKSTGAATVDIGVAATAVSNDSLMDGLDVNAATGLFDNVTNKGTNGKPEAVWAATGFVTVAEASGDVAALVGALTLLCYLR